MSPGLFLLVLEVMDKEPSPLSLWAVAGIVGALGYSAARWRRWTAVISITVIGAIGIAVGTELRGPSVGPAIIEEAGTAYRWHVAGSLAVAFMLTLAGTRRSLRGAA